jgi:hypothetical protein
MQFHQIHTSVTVLIPETFSIFGLDRPGFKGTVGVNQRSHPSVFRFLLQEEPRKSTSKPLYSFATYHPRLVDTGQERAIYIKTEVLIIDIDRARIMGTLQKDHTSYSSITATDTSMEVHTSVNLLTAYTSYNFRLGGPICMGILYKDRNT